MKETKHGVLSAGTLTYISNKKWEEVGLTHLDTSLDGLYELAMAHNLTHLWIMETASIIPDEAWFNQSCHKWFTNWIEDVHGNKELLIGATRERQAGTYQKPFTLVFPRHTEWSWCEYEGLTPKLLLCVVKYLEMALDVPVGSGSSTVGTKLLERLCADKKHLLAPLQANLEELPFSSAACDIVEELKWMLSVVKQGKYLHKVDKNSAYLRSADEEWMGYGEPKHVAGSEYKDGYPGVWRIAIKKYPIVAERKILDSEIYQKLPDAMWDTEWVSSPMVKCLTKLGYIFDIKEGWMFPNRYKTLEKWANFLWAARQSFRNEKDIAEKWKHPIARELARDGIKDVATKTVGLFGMTGLVGTGKWKYRPDWRAQVVGSTRALMFYNMVKYAIQGYFPCMVYMDALFFITDTPELIPGIIDHKDSLGGYKHEYTILIDAEVENVLREKIGPAPKIGKLNRIAKKRGSK